MKPCPVGALAGISLALLICYPWVWLSIFGGSLALVVVVLLVDTIRTRKVRRQLLSGPAYLKA